MSRKNTMFLSEKIEQLIQNGLRHRFDGRAPVSVFLESQHNSVRRIVNKWNTVQLVPDNEEAFHVFVYRLPQTRIYYSLYQNIQWQIKILDFRDTVLFLIHKTGQKSEIQIRTQFPDAQILKVKDVGDSDAKKRSRAEIFWVFPDKETVPPSAPSALLASLQAELQAQYDLYLLKGFKIAQHEIQVEFDRWLAQLPHIDAHGRLHSAAVDKTEFIWVHELYLQLFQWDRLDEFYQGFSSQQVNASPILSLLSRRFDRFRQSVAAHEAKLSKGKDGKAYHSFLESYLWGTDDEIAFERDLQAFWENLQMPVLYFHWKEEINKNPDDYIAFALSAICHRFWWSAQAVDFVSGFLPQTHRTVFRLLSTIMSQICIAPAGKSLRIISLGEPKADRYLQSEGIAVRFYAYGKQKYSHLEIKESDSITINLNQWVDFQLDFAHKTVQLIPVFFKPPLRILPWRTVLIEYEGFKVIFPLIWEAATLKINRCRLKFLRKKKRFQISLKNPESKKSVKIEGIPIEIRPDGKAKTYLPIIRGKGQIMVEAFTEKGSKIYGLTSGENKITLRGHAFDVFGILKQDFRVHLDGQRRSYGVKTNNLESFVLPIARSSVDLRLTCRKCLPQNLHLKSVDPFWGAFLRTPASILINEFKLWIADEVADKIEREEFVRILFERLKWIPEIETVAIDHFYPQNRIFNLLISLSRKEEDEKIAQIGDISIYRTAKHPKLKYFQIDVDNWRNIFSLNFFMENFQKI